MLAGEPILMALATVSGLSKSWPATSGEAPFGLEAEHAGGRVGVPRPSPLTETLPVRGDVAGVTHGQGQRVGWISESFRDLEGRGLLALYTVGVYRIDQRDVAELLGDPLGELQRRVEVALDLDYPRPVREDLYSLAQRYLARGYDDEALHARTRRVGRRRSRRVPRRSADAGAAPCT